MVQQTHQMELVVLVVDEILGDAALGRKRITIVEYVVIGACLRPEVIGFGRMDVGIVAVGRRQHMVVVGGVGHLPADVDRAPVDHGNGGAVDQAVDERGGGVLENLHLAAGELVGRLRPVVVFQGDHEDRLDRVPIVVVRVVVRAPVVGGGDRHRQRRRQAAEKHRIFHLLSPELSEREKRHAVSATLTSAETHRGRVGVLCNRNNTRHARSAAPRRSIRLGERSANSSRSARMTPGPPLRLTSLGAAVRATLQQGYLARVPYCAAVASILDDQDTACRFSAVMATAARRPPASCLTTRGGMSQGTWGADLIESLSH